MSLSSALPPARPPRSWNLPRKAKAVNADIILFTEAETSPIGELSTLVYRMQADADRLPDSLGWYSEYAINLCYECIVMYLMKKRGLSKEKMESELANLY